MSLARVQNFSISLDGFATGEGQSLDAPFGHAGERLHDWMFATRWGHEMLGQPGGSGGIDDAFARLFTPGIGAEIMGAGKFGPPGWHEDPEWKGCVGSQPAVPHADLRPHPSPAPVDRDGGRHDVPLHRRFAGRGARDGPRGCGRPGRTHRRRSHHDPRLPCCRAHRPHARRGGPDPARPRRPPLGRAGGPREGLRDRGRPPRPAESRM